MKQFKMLGVGVLAVLLLTALGGVPAAMAETEPTELCKADETTCKAENAITTVHEVTPELKKAVLLTSFGNVECNVLFLGEIPDETTSGPAFISGKFTYTSCLLKGSTCEVNEVSKGSLLIFSKEGKETGAVKTTTEFSVKCGASIGCTFAEESLVGSAKGPLVSTLTNGEVSYKEVAIKKATGTLCPKESKLDIAMSPLVETFLSQGNMYCVRDENSWGRWQFGPNSTTCEGNVGIQGRNYELVTSRRAGLTAGTMLCRRDEGSGFYLTRINGTECGNKDEPNPLGVYELSEVA